MGQHTPGPWRVEWIDDSHGWILDKVGNYLFEIVTSDEEGLLASPAEQVANARLTAAAPTLLTMLERLLREVGDTAGILALAVCSLDIEQARAAIAKATN
jgi:hypothetical protein